MDHYIPAAGKEIRIVQADITGQAVDAIVNPANSQLQHGGGAALAIAKAGGAVITAQSREYIRQKGLLPVGTAMATDGGKLPARYVIHTVGPRMGEGQEDAKLEQAIWSALTVAEELRLYSLAMPAVSSGIFGFPKERCACILLDTAIRFLQRPGIELNLVIMCNFDRETTHLFQTELTRKFAHSS